MNIDRVLEELDALHMENKKEEIGVFLGGKIREAMEEGDSGSVLVLLNELVGFLRETNNYEEGLIYAQQAIQLVDGMGLTGTVPHATTLINAANLMRAAGHLADAVEAYEDAGKIYDGVLDPDDFSFAGLYNNLSLVYMEVPDYEKAIEYLKKALRIVELHKEGNTFELAVTHTNLGNSMLHMAMESGSGDVKEARQHLEAAEEIFERRKIFNTHYAATVMGLGEIEELSGNTEEACRKYEKGMQAVLNNFGYTEFYYRIKERYDRLDVKKTGGFEICRDFYNEKVKPLFEKELPVIFDIADIGLIGQGSDCYMTDDIASRDHDWGPAVCIWLLKEDYEKYADKAKELYDRLPDEYRGYTRVTSPQGGGRVGVLCFEDFVKDLMGKHSGERILNAVSGREKIFYGDWLSFDEISLSALTNGGLFDGRGGFFAKLRDFLSKGYPDKVKRTLLAQHCSLYSQNLQYNFRRMALRGDELSAGLMLNSGLRSAWKICFLLSDKFAPHDKWLPALAERTAAGEGISEKVRAISEGVKKLSFRDMTERDLDEVNGAIEKLTIHLAAELSKAGFVSGERRGQAGIYLEDLAMEIMNDDRRGTPWSQIKNENWDEGRIRGFFESFSLEDLPLKLAEMEFAAFDEVKNQGGRADCQDNWGTFSIMRRSQYNCWTKEMMVRYATDFMLSIRDGWNPIAEKYGRMEASTAPGEWEKIKGDFVTIDEEAKAIIETIVGIQVGWMENFAKEYPAFAGNARSIHTYEDTPGNTSYETYLRGELSCYSGEMLALYGAFIADLARSGKNLAYLTMEQTAKLYGYENLDDAEKKLVNS
ncbi:MAG: DUF4125 family protein [Lachnospiraceae bacterium]|nr:DUF4125 family protein [Lachnospiraceae bacterium]